MTFGAHEPIPPVPEYTGHEKTIHPPTLAGARVAAALIDLSILGVGFWFALQIETIVAWVAFWTGVFFYYFLTELYWGGRTPGKVVVGVRVAQLDGEEPTAGQVFVRTVLRAIDGLPAVYVVGAMLMAFSKHEQRLGDLVARTVVVRARKRGPLE